MADMGLDRGREQCEDRGYVAQVNHNVLLMTSARLRSLGRQVPVSYGRPYLLSGDPGSTPLLERLLERFIRPPGREHTRTVLPRPGLYPPQSGETLLSVRNASVSPQLAKGWCV